MQVSLNLNRWRMLRIAIKKKRTPFVNLRSFYRKDIADVQWLIENGFLVEVADEVYEVTAKGRESADLGFYDWQPPARQAPPPKPASPKKTGGKK